tara:strand:+ start:19081 stop:19479 length:399 start_codon:yes stop_codon:yes gene_type:complete
MKSIDLACIIDDDPIYLFGIQKMMKVAELCRGFLIYHNGLEAFNALKPMLEDDKNFPEIILLDLNMPIMDGWQFLDKITRIPTQKKVTIYIISSSIDPVDMDRAKRYSVVSSYIIKPVKMGDLKNIFSELVD